MGSPPSPREKSNIALPSSPKRSQVHYYGCSKAKPKHEIDLTLTPTLPAPTKVTSYQRARSSTQYAQLLKQKIPIILQALCGCDGGGVMSSPSSYSPNAAAMRSGVDFAVPRKTVDALGLVLCSGNEVSTLLDKYLPSPLTPPRRSICRARCPCGIRTIPSPRPT